MRRLALLLLLAAAPAPAPAGYWTGPAGGEVPAAVPGAVTVRSAAAAADLAARGAVPVDVSPAPKRPPSMAAGVPWLPLAHLDIPGSLWVPDAGLALLPAGVRPLLSRVLAERTRQDRLQAVLVYCHRHCWLSWNAAKRIAAAGYRRVYWYPDGVEGWRDAGQPVAAVEPALP